MSGNSAKLEIKSVTDNIGLARVTVASFAAQLDFTLSEIEEIKVAVSEAVSNAIIHGYSNDDGVITIGLEIDDEELVISVEDYGQGILNIEQACEPSYTTADRMGLGLVFIESFMDDLNITSTVDEGTQIRMIKVPEKLKRKAN
ncbi:anti-sigma F factor [Selenihalanaerobacter shriftii]|uniref:Anti-sigma F factor n=1 Tax=Selenihalanaerobacter shriftii TaxID=142842 RepID=A0A1T4M5A3_9FIRM|nr:anti-sigma F factor [Selenihalanaerobacter shriftii]SJZ62153.1 stage II sporulation protein AB (anti-sigma F factor) [Selenihalanaerobacter shriftii]